MGWQVVGSQFQPCMPYKMMAPKHFWLHHGKHEPRDCYLVTPTHT